MKAAIFTGIMKFYTFYFVLLIVKKNTTKILNFNL